MKYITAIRTEIPTQASNLPAQGIQTSRVAEDAQPFNVDHPPYPNLQAFLKPDHAFKNVDLQFTIPSRTPAITEVMEPDNFRENLQVFRRVHVLYDENPEGLKAATIRALLDTGSSATLMFKYTLDDLQLNFLPYKKTRSLYNSATHRFRVIGTRELTFMYRGKSQIHQVDVLVLEDPKDGTKPSFDILLGRDHLLSSNAIVGGHMKVIGDTY